MTTCGGWGCTQLLAPVRTEPALLMCSHVCDPWLCWCRSGLGLGGRCEVAVVTVMVGRCTVCPAPCSALPSSTTLSHVHTLWAGSPLAAFPWWHRPHLHLLWWVSAVVCHTACMHACMHVCPYVPSLVLYVSAMAGHPVCAGHRPSAGVGICNSQAVCWEYGTPCLVPHGNALAAGDSGRGLSQAWLHACSDSMVFLVVYPQ